MVDSGSGISLMPKSIFDDITRTQTAELRPPDRLIKGVNGLPVECHGLANVTLEFEGQTVDYDFYVCEDSVDFLLGRDFQYDHRVSICLRDKLITINGVKVTAYDVAGNRVNTVNLLRTMTIRPGEEVQLSAKVKGKGRPNGTVCMIDPSRTLFARTGALVARTCVKPKKTRAQSGYSIPLKVT